MSRLPERANARFRNRSTARLRTHRLPGVSLRALTAGVLFVSALLLSGCVNQKKEVQTYRAVVDAGLPRPAPYSPGESLSLQRSLALANQDNESIGINGENYLQALINKNRAVAAFLPTVSLQPSYTIEELPRLGSSAGPITGAAAAAAASAGGFTVSGNTAHKFEAPVVGSMNLFRGFGDVANLKAAEQNIVQERQLLLDAQAVVLLNVAQTYYQVLRSEAQVRVLRNSLDLQNARVAYVESEFRNHLALALEVSQTRAQAAGTQVQLTQAESDVRNARRTLAFLLAVAQVDGPLVDDVQVPQSLPPVEWFRAQAAANRRDLQAAVAQVNAERFAVDAAIAEYYPSVNLNVAGFLYREDFANASKWDAILIANIPIFSAGIIEADVRTAWSKLRQAALNESLLRRQIDQDVQNAYDNLTTSTRELVDLQAEVQAASDALTQSEQLRDNGLALPLDVLTAQDTLLNAQLTYTSESFDRTVFFLDLARIVGRLTPRAAQDWEVPSDFPTTAPSTMPVISATMPATQATTVP